MQSHTENIWWTIGLTIVGSMGIIAVFWDRVGRALVLKVLWPIVKYFVAFGKMPYDINRLSHEVSNNGGKSLKDLIEKNTAETMTISNQVKLINRRSRAAMAISPHANFEADSSGRWVWANKALYRLFGATGDDIRDWKWMTFVCDEDRTRIEERWNVSIIRGEDVDTAFTILKGGSERQDRIKVHAYVHVMKDEDDRVLGYFGMIMREPL